MRKTLMTLVLCLAVAIGLATLASAQSVEVTIANGAVTFKNTGNQEVISLLATVAATPDPSLKSTTANVTSDGIFGHEWYFKPQGLVVGGTTDPMHTSNPTLTDSSKITIRWVQYADGSTWGSGGEIMTAQRPTVLDFLNKLNSTTTDTDFVAALNATQPSGSLVEAKARSLRDIYTQYGVSPTRASVATSLQAAKSRSF